MSSEESSIVKINNEYNINNYMLDTESLKQIGTTQIKNNPFYNDLANAMSNPFIRNFFKKYFSDEMDSKTCMMYIDIHFKVEELLKIKYSSQEITEDLVIGIVNELMMNSKSRSLITQNFTNLNNNIKNIKN